MYLFICKVSTSSSIDADNQDQRQKIEDMFHNLRALMRIWKAQSYEDYSVTQPAGYCEMGNVYRRTDHIYFYRYVHHLQSIPALAKICEGAAQLAGQICELETFVSYPDELPALAPSPQEPDG